MHCVTTWTVAPGSNCEQPAARSQACRTAMPRRRRVAASHCARSRRCWGSRRGSRWWRCRYPVKSATVAQSPGFPSTRDRFGTTTWTIGCSSSPLPAIRRRTAPSDTPAKSARVLVNCVDDAEHSTAHFPAIVNRGPVTVGISTDGTSPTLARRLREQIEALLPGSLGSLASYLGSRRERVKTALPDLHARQQFWDQALDSPLVDLVARGAIDQADDSLSEMLGSPIISGVVSLVGAGPGDPDLMTLRAMHRLQRADVIYHDKLVGAGILDRCRRDSRKVDVGRRAGDVGSAVSRQEFINDRLEADARRGLRVVRLKGGDPLVFGRGWRGDRVAYPAGRPVRGRSRRDRWPRQCGHRRHPAHASTVGSFRALRNRPDSSGYGPPLARTRQARPNACRLHGTQCSRQALHSADGRRSRCRNPCGGDIPGDSPRTTNSVRFHWRPGCQGSNGVPRRTRDNHHRTGCLVRATQPARRAHIDERRSGRHLLGPPKVWEG